MESDRHWSIAGSSTRKVEGAYSLSGGRGCVCGGWVVRVVDVGENGQHMMGQTHSTYTPSIHCVLHI